MKVKVDEELCIGCGMCEASGNFQIIEGVSHLLSTTDPECIREVASMCPQGAIQIEED